MAWASARRHAPPRSRERHRTAAIPSLRSRTSSGRPASSHPERGHQCRRAIEIAGSRPSRQNLDGRPSPCLDLRLDLDYGNNWLGALVWSAAGPTRSRAMPLITVQMYEGRTVEQKRELVAALTEAVVRIAKTTPEATQIIIQDVPRHNWAFPAKLASDS